MSSILRQYQDEREFKALSGVSRKEFRELLPVFTESDHELRWEAYVAEHATRQRKPGGGQKGTLKRMDQKLFFILYYWKVSPTFDVLGDRFGLDRSKACTNVHALWPVLERTLDTLGVLPARRFANVEELRAAFGEVEELFIDATEREHVRPQDAEEQRKTFSGKKKRNTVKHPIMSTACKLILFLGDTVAGSIHDYRRFKEEFSLDERDQDGLVRWFRTFKLWVDLGYLGIQKEYDALEIKRPHKKPRKSQANPNPTLTEAQKAENRALSRVRVVVEHAIGGMKRVTILTQKFRNRKDTFVDTVAVIGAGLWNWKLRCQMA
jgi:hypothetical protein